MEDMKMVCNNIMYVRLRTFTVRNKYHTGTVDDKRRFGIHYRFRLNLCAFFRIDVSRNICGVHFNRIGEIADGNYAVIWLTYTL